MRFFFLSLAFSFALCKYSTGQIICIYCYDQNDSISSGVNNLLLNGGFEDPACAGGYIVDVFCPNSSYYSCNLANWTCTGGGQETYACIFNNDIDSRSFVPEGTRAAYLGNFFPNTCSAIFDDTSCLINLGCTVTGIPPGYPVNTPDYGGAAGVSINQTVTGLTIGQTYILEFWAGGEVNDDFFENNGLFAVDVGFGDTFLRCKPTPHLGGIGTTYIIEFNATSTSHTIKFTNWGHMSTFCTEVVLDNIRLYTLAELSSAVPSCNGSSSSASFTASDTVVCQKFCVSFVDSSTNNPTSWQWLFPGGDPSSSIDQNPASICYNNPGVYDVTLITTNTFGNDTLTLIDYITVYPTPPLPSISQTGYTLTSTPAPAYQWQFNNVDIPGATNQSYQVTQSGAYTVVTTNENGCSSSSTVNVLITGLYDISADADVLIYPNPSNGNFIVELSNCQVDDELKIEIRNMFGQIIFSSEEETHSFLFKKEINLSERLHSEPYVSIGIYFLEIKTLNEFVRKKILISY